MTVRHKKRWLIGAIGVLAVAAALVPAVNASAGPPTPDAATNLVTNPGFESGTSGWTLTGTPQVSSTARSGSSALQMGPGQAGASQQLDLAPSTTYTVSAWAELVGSTDYSQVSLRIVDGSGNSHDYQMPYTGGRYALQGRVITTPSSVSEALLYVLKNSGSGDFYVDDVSVVAGRDPKIWPFTSNSIWNTPIGSGAQYVPAGFESPSYVSTDPTYFYDLSTMNSSDYASYDLKTPDGAPSGNNVGRCNGTTPLGTIEFPNSEVVPDGTESPYSTPNNVTAIVQPDGRTIQQLQPLARCTASGDVHGYRASTDDLYGYGTYGAHFGSGLSSLGGTLRLGELTDELPISHALQLEVWGRMYLDFDTSSKTPGYRWPAGSADGYAGGTNGYCSLDPCKSNPIPGLVQGSLLAIPPSDTASSLGLTTAAGKKLFAALQNYGGYLVDDTGGANDAVGIDRDAAAAVNWSATSLQADLKTLFSHLSVVNNNESASLGGGGTPRVASAPGLSAAPAGPTALSESGWTATASQNSSQAKAVLDGDDSTTWTTGQPIASNQWLDIDMTKSQCVTKLRTDTGGVAAGRIQNYWVEMSNDNATWKFVTAGTGAPVTMTSFPSTCGRYFRIVTESQGLTAQPLTWTVGNLTLYD